MRTRDAAAVVLAPVLVVAVLGVLTIGRVAFWRDEFASRDVASLPVGQLFSATGHVDFVFTPYYLALHGWSSIFGSSAVALRVPSLLAGTATVALVAHTVQLAWGRVAGLTAGIALATNPLFFTAFVQARPYALCLLACTAATALLIGATGRRWAVYSALVTVAVALQVFAVLILLGHVAAVAGRSRRDPPPPYRNFLLAAVVPCVVAAVLLAVGRTQQGQVSWVDALGLPGTVRAWLDLAGGTVPGLLAGAAALGVLLSPRVRAAGLWRTGIALWVLPIIALALVSALTTPVLVPRYLIAAPLGVAMVIGAGAALATRGVARLGGPRWLPTVAGVLLVGLVVLTNLSGLRAAYAVPFPDWRPVGAALAAELRPGDLLVVEQAYYEGGLAAGVAEFDGDSALGADVRSDLAAGAPLRYVREVIAVNPLQTAPFSAGIAGREVAVVGVTHDLDPARNGTDTEPPGCSSASPDRPIRYLAGADAYIAWWRC